LKVRGDKQSVTNWGKLFHARGPATAKTLSPSDMNDVLLAPQEWTLSILLLFFILLGRLSTKRPKLRRFKCDRGEIWQDYSSRRLNTHRLTESDFRYDKIKFVDSGHDAI